MIESVIGNVDMCIVVSNTITNVPYANKKIPDEIEKNLFGAII
jgi:hypothetical protein